MNPYLIEPYNAWTRGAKRKKHWTELMEEEALYHQMVQDQIRLRESKTQQMTVQDSVQDGSPAVGNGAAAAGAGGVPPREYFNPGGKVINFSGTPLSGDAPLTVQFTNGTSEPEGDTFLWLFGDGTTSSDINPSHIYGSDASGGTDLTLTGSYTVTLQMTQSSMAQMSSSTKTAYISASRPTINAFSLTPSRTRTNTSDVITWTSNVSGANSFTWSFGDGGGPTASRVNPFPLSYAYTAQARITASLTASNWVYGLAPVAGYGYVMIDQPVIPFFVATSQSGSVPLNVTFSNRTTGSSVGGALTYQWDLGSGSVTSTQTNPSMSYTVTGSFTVYLNATSSFGSASRFTSASMVMVGPA